ncbi:hypothetical protein AZ78_2264 [Lysobacter capsici AZ78]|uniref:Uncharacterized protein n=1 Tax=Lysobacter capsici AZ78 TaxID=1444315 RepID=A0A108U8W3_9GAMM|nr:hypothetical protein AZ78_2264 [Lysobacter capsici AZ78]
MRFSLKVQRGALFGRTQQRPVRSLMSIDALSAPITPE